MYTATALAIRACCPELPRIYLKHQLDADMTPFIHNHFILYYILKTGFCASMFFRIFSENLCPGDLFYQYEPVSGFDLISRKSVGFHHLFPCGVKPFGNIPQAVSRLHDVSCDSGKLLKLLQVKRHLFDPQNHRLLHWLEHQDI